MSSLHGHAGGLEPPAEGNRAYVGVALEAGPDGRVEFSAVRWPYPPCRSIPVAWTREIEPWGFSRLGAAVRRWRVGVGSSGAERVIFCQDGRYFVRSR